MPDETPYAGGLLARRLSHLFTTVLPPGKKAYTPADIANAINQAAGERITSGTYIWQLKTGRRDNPTIRLVNALARAFGVSPVYFLDEAAGQAPLPAELVTALRDDAVRDIALRSAGLSERSLDVIRATVELARERDLAEHRRAPAALARTRATPAKLDKFSPQFKSYKGSGPLRPRPPQAAGTNIAPPSPGRTERSHALRHRPALRATGPPARAATSPTPARSRGPGMLRARAPTRTCSTPRQRNAPGARAAKAICSRCPVKGECQTYSMTAREEFGIWAASMNGSARNSSPTASPMTARRSASHDPQQARAASRRPPAREAARPVDRRQAELLQSALAMAARGWHVFPCATGGKQPALRGNWQHHATTNATKIRAWWQARPHNIGLACGPSRLVVIDLDTSKEPAQPSGADALPGPALRQERQPLPSPTYAVSTPSGGSHLYFAAPGTPITNSASRLAPLIDIRAADGYVIAPGSQVNGRPYATRNARNPAPLPTWLAQKLAPLPPAPLQAASRTRVANDPRATAYAMAALRSEADRLASAPDGTCDRAR